MTVMRTEFMSAALRWLGGITADGRCQRCSFDWSVSPDDALGIIAASPARIHGVLDVRDGMAIVSDQGWNATAYVWHLTDMARGWSERWIQLRDAPGSSLIGWDLDLLAEARNYTALATVPALWALDASVATFVSLSEQMPVDVSFRHGEWGMGTIGDVLVWLAHEHVHHLLDIDERAANPPSE